MLKKNEHKSTPEKDALLEKAREKIRKINSIIKKEIKKLLLRELDFDTEE